MELEREELEARLRLGAKIREAREAKVLTQKQLADALNLSEGQVISNYECGKNEVKRHRLKQIAEETGKPLEFFFEPEEWLTVPDAKPSTSEQFEAILAELRQMRGLLEELAGGREATGASG